MTVDLFQRFRPNPNKANFGYDLNLLPPANGITPALAVLAGNPVLAPATDINGAPRQSPPDLGSYAYIAPYKGTISFLGNARQIGTPTLVFFADGQRIGSVIVTANLYDGKLRAYTFNYTLSHHPTMLTVTLENFSTTYNALNGVAIYSLDVASGSEKNKNILPTGVAGGLVKFQHDGASFFTNGSTLEFNISKL